LALRAQAGKIAADRPLEALAAIGMVLLMNVGGASGPLQQKGRE
jgi:hypothetical protein